MDNWGYYSSMALLEDGIVWVWGDGARGTWLRRSNDNFVPAGNLTDELWEKVFAVNTTGPMRTS